MLELRVVLDTNVLVSRLLTPHSVTAQAVRKLVTEAQLLVSEATLTELADVLSRNKFDPYASLEDRREFFQRIAQIAEMVPVATSIRACRDAKDNKFLEVAVDGNAKLLVTGDGDLLALSPFRTVGIVTPAQALALPDSAYADGFI